MTTLVLLRHAKAVASDPDGDHQRRLNEDGRRAAARAGETLRAIMPRIDLALISDAQRTRETADLAFPSSSSGPVTTRIEPELYAASTEAMMAMLLGLQQAYARVLIVGHNPGIGDLARRLCGPGAPGAVAAMRDHFPTASLAVLDFGALRWCDLRPKTGTLTHFVEGSSP